MWLILSNKFEICNDAAVNVLGYTTQEELTSTHPSALSPPLQADGADSFVKAEQMMRTALDKGYHRFEWTHRKKSGEDFPVEVTLTAIPYEGEIGIYCVWRDVSARKKIEDKLIYASDVAEEANMAKSKFLALMSHELRTPLNAVIGFSELLALQALGPLNEKQTSIVTNIHRGGTLLLNLVNDLLDFAKIESGQFDIDIQTVDPCEIVETAISIVQRDVRFNDINLHWSAETKSLRPIKADKFRAVQSMVNLLSNAIKYNESGGNLWVELLEMEKDGFLTISVEDDGCGIKSEDFENIFIAFNRGNQKHSHIEGTGLGLNVTKRLIEAMKGRVRLESTWGVGSTFLVDLPKA